MWEHDNLDEVQKELLDKNVISIGGDIDSKTVLYVRESLLRLIGRESPAIELYITSSGGSVDIGLDVYDLLRSYPGEITGIVKGYARSMAAVILQACKKRIAMRHSYILIHHISRREVSLDTLRDPEKTAQIRDDLEKAQAMIYKILSDKTEHSEEKIKSECDKNQDMTAEEALEFGLVDEVL